MTTIQLDAGLLGELDFVQLAAELRVGNLFPSQVGVRAATSTRQFAEMVPAALEHGYQVQALEAVQVPKLDRSTRIALDIPADDLLVYGALRALVRRSMHEGLVTLTGTLEEGQSYEEFERHPLTLEDASYVIEADVAAFYEYVDHQRLGEELLGLTGSARLAEAVSDALEGWVDRPYGIPQGPPPSAFFADVYISPVARTLLRAGLHFSRYSDDFRIAARSWPDARRAQMVLETALRTVGLTIAPKKMQTLRVETYQRYLEKADEVRLSTSRTTGAAEVLLAAGYALDEPLAFQPSAADIGSAEEVLGELLQINHATVLTTRLGRAALRILSRAPTTIVLENLPFLLDRYAHLTQLISANLRYVGAMGLKEVPRLITEWLERPTFRYPWQVGWVLHASSFAAERNERLGSFAQMALFDQQLPWFARGQAAIVAARHSQLPNVDRLFDAWERAPNATKPDLAAAVVLSESPWRDDFLDGVRVTPLLVGVTSLNREDFRQWL